MGGRLLTSIRRRGVTETAKRQNVAVQRPPAKVGFVRTAEMRLRRIVGRSRTALDADESPPGRMLRRLAR